MTEILHQWGEKKLLKFLHQEIVQHKNHIIKHIGTGSFPKFHLAQYLALTNYLTRLV